MRLIFGPLIAMAALALFAMPAAAALYAPDAGPALFEPIDRFDPMPAFDLDQAITEVAALCTIDGGGDPQPDPAPEPAPEPPVGDPPPSEFCAMPLDRLTPK